MTEKTASLQGALPKAVPGGLLFWLSLVLIAKLALVSNIDVQIRYSPFDDSLYVSRAYAFLANGTWGNYDAYVLAKFPFISLWLVVSRSLGVPYLLGVNVLYGLAGIYLLRAAARAGVGQAPLVLAFLAYELNPITFSVGWALVMREALSSGLMVLMLGASLRILSAKGEKLPWLAMGLFSCVFALSLLLREEDRLLWLFLALLAAAAALVRSASAVRRIDFKFLLVLLLLPCAVAVSVSYSVRQFNERVYGEPLLTDYGEGEFPKLMATLRSIDSTVDNRLVMLPQELIARLRSQVPDFEPVLSRLPLAGTQTYSCKLQNVCSEWSNGWMPWWVKQAAAEAGMTPTLPQAQAYFRKIRQQIEALCANGKLRCSDKGAGLLPPMELRWFRAYWEEFLRLLSMLVFPKVELVAAPSGPPAAAASLVQMYQRVTMTSVAAREQVPVATSALADETDAGIVLADWRAQLSFGDGVFVAFAMLAATAALVWRWAMYPGVAITPLYALCLVFWAYSLARLMALSYVAVFFGPFEPRIVFSTCTAMGILSVLALVESVQAGKTFKLLRS